MGEFFHKHTGYDSPRIHLNDIEGLGTPSFPSAFGDGSDKTVDINSGAFSSGPITSNALTRDAYFQKLTLSGGNLDTKGYRLFCRRTLTIGNTRVIFNNGGNGGGPGTNGAAGVGALSGSLRGGTNGGKGGGNGGNRGGGAGAGGAGVVLIAAKNISNNGIIRANGGNGGNGLTPSFTSSAGSDGVNLSCGNGGNGGGGGNAAANAGGSGGTVTVTTQLFKIMTTGLLAIDSVLGLGIGGGVGGAGGGGQVGNSAGGGGGGGGGFVLIYYSETPIWGTEEAVGGTKGNGVDGADNGVDGSAGTVKKIKA